MHDYVLYHFPTCPYCQKVFRYMEQAGITVPTKNTWDPGVEDPLTMKSS